MQKWSDCENNLHIDSFQIAFCIALTFVVVLKQKMSHKITSSRPFKKFDVFMF